MEKENRSITMFFIIKGISEIPELQTPIFILILLIYLVTASGNATIIFLVFMDQILHTPMYYLLVSLALLDISSATLTQHKILSTFITGDNTISFLGCTLQVYMYFALAADEMYILAAMSYDRYLAICKPLHYPVIMNRKICALLTIVCWVWGFLEILPIFLLISEVSCFKSNIIKHFYCDIVPVMKLSCSDISVLEITILTEALILCLTPLFLTITSYIFIVITILKIKSSSGRFKTFYTCSSHLTVVTLFYVSLFSLYLKPNSTHREESKKFFSLINTALVPLLNPMIYSLKNNDVKMAMRRQLTKCKVTG